MGTLPTSTPPPQTNPAYIQCSLGRLFIPSPQDYPAAHLLSVAKRAALALPKRRTYRTWFPPRHALDQGATESCVEHMVAHRFMGAPDPHDAIIWPHFSLYKRAQAIDEWPGSETEPPIYYGTSVRAGLEVGRLGFTTRMSDGTVVTVPPFIHSYWKLNTLDELLDYLLASTYALGGSVAMGTNWSDGMWDIDRDGFLNYDSSKVRGGHAWELYMGNTDLDSSGGQNSWGADWGINGRFRLHIRGSHGLEGLLNDDGDAFAVIELGTPMALVAEQAKATLGLPSKS